MRDSGTRRHEWLRFSGNQIVGIALQIENNLLDIYAVS